MMMDSELVDLLTLLLPAVDALQRGAQALHRLARLPQGKAQPVAQDVHVSRVRSGSLGSIWQLLFSLAELLVSGDGGEEEKRDRDQPSCQRDVISTMRRNPPRGCAAERDLMRCVVCRTTAYVRLDVGAKGVNSESRSVLMQKHPSSPSFP